jgi:DHA1 family bicyclomycin/chloramphenicol resistance-like MFS transporter
LTASIKQPSRGEFVALMAVMMSLIALSIDAMLPALPYIAESLGVQNDNDRQAVVSVVFLGMAIGQLIYGPFSDSTGRKPVIFFGIMLFVVGCLMCIFATTYTTMLVGRFLQGVGVAAPRNLTVAIVRDRFAGNAMAQVMSLIMSIFILVPMMAPALGQLVLWVSDWRGIFVMFLVIALIVLTWFTLRQPETLARENRRPFKLASIWQAFVEVCTNRLVVAYTMAASLVSGAFIGYLVSAQQIFQELYKTGSAFAFYFAVASISLGVAALVNSRLVMRHGMAQMTNWALWFLSMISALFLLLVTQYAGAPPFWMFMTYLFMGLFPVGILFGNLNAMAMEPLGHIAGMGAAVIGSVTTILSLFLGGLVGYLFDNTIIPLIAGFAILCGGALVICVRTERSVRWQLNSKED